MRAATLPIVAAWLALATGAGAAELTVGAGSSVDLGTGALDLGCANLTVGGTLSAGSLGFDGARDVSIDPAGVVNGNTGTLGLSGDWDNAGTFNAGTSSVEIADGCGLLSGVVAGNTSFAGLSITSSSARQQSFEAGSTTTVGGSLSLAGQNGALLGLRSTQGGSVAFLISLGGSSTAFLDVDDIDASGGSPIALGPESVKGSNTPGWTLATAVPALGLLGLALLAAGLLWSGRRRLGLLR